MIYFLTDFEGKILAQAEADGAVMLQSAESIPARTDADGTPGAHEQWELRLVNGAHVWTKQPRPMTDVEQLQQRNDELEAAMIELAALVGGMENG